MKTTLYCLLLTILLSGCNRGTEQPCDDHYIKGSNYALLGDLQSADREFDLALKQDAMNANAWYGKGTVYHMRNKGNEAIECFDKAISLNPQLALAYYERGVCHKAASHTDKALKDMHEANRLLPNVSITKIVEASYMADYSHHQDAIALLTEVIRTEPSNIMALTTRANCCYILGQKDAALKDYLRVLDMQGPQATTCYYISNLYYEKGDYQHALDHLNEAIRLHADYPGLSIRKGIYEYSLSKKDEACTDFHKALEEGDTTAKQYIEKYCTKN
ncbi:MAG: tetratricopeptide repeat protein [Bacteroidetes bacterium]|nr:tetratricopeptide repeat protein [Bacteroidota bacterium]